MLCPPPALIPIYTFFLEVSKCLVPGLGIVVEVVLSCCRLPTQPRGSRQRAQLLVAHEGAFGACTKTPLPREVALGQITRGLVPDSCRFQLLPGRSRSVYLLAAYNYNSITLLSYARTVCELSKNTRAVLAHASLAVSVPRACLAARMLPVLGSRLKIRSCPLWALFHRGVKQRLKGRPHRCRELLSTES